MAEQDALTLARITKKSLENLKQVQAYLTIELGHEVTQHEALSYLIDGFLSKKGNAPKENGSPHLESPEVPYP